MTLHMLYQRLRHTHTVQVNSILQLRWWESNVMRVHSCDHAHYILGAKFSGHFKNLLSDYNKLTQYMPTAPPVAFRGGYDVR